MNFETVCRGVYLEGLCSDADTIWVSDPIRGGLRRLDANGISPVFLPETRWIGGLLLNSDGKVLFSGVDGIRWLDGDTGDSGVLVDSVDGEPMPGVNEMVADGHGGIYFGSLDASTRASTSARHSSSVRRSVALIAGSTHSTRVSPSAARAFCSSVPFSASTRRNASPS